ncbi:hypothetical protein JCM8097_006617 [Rhodosporidiobolus ruineniae]
MLDRLPPQILDAILHTTLVVFHRDFILPPSLGPVITTLLETHQLQAVRVSVPESVKPLKPCVSLARFSLVDVEIYERAIARLLKPDVLPSLRILELGRCFIPAPQQAFFHSVEPALALRLDLLVLRLSNEREFSPLIHRNHLSTLPPAFLALPTVVLAVGRLKGDLRHLLRLNPAHLRLLGPSNPFSTGSAELEQLTAPTVDTPFLYLHLQQDALIEACTLHQVELFWHNEVYEQPSIPKAFLQYARKLKAKQAAEAAEETATNGRV